MRNLYFGFVCANLLFVAINLVLGSPWSWVVFNFVCALSCYVGYTNTFKNDEHS